jgi:hypothetical protein
MRDFQMRFRLVGDGALDVVFGVRALSGLPAAFDTTAVGHDQRF